MNLVSRVLTATPRVVTGVLATGGIVSALLVFGHPAGLSPAALSWLGAGAAISLALVAALPSIVAGTVTPSIMRRAIAEGTSPLGGDPSPPQGASPQGASGEGAGHER